MVDKSSISRQIVQALLDEQRNPTRIADKIDDSVPFAMPPQLPIGNGRFLPATSKILADIGRYVEVLRNNNEFLPISHSDADLREIVGRAFGTAFFPIDLDQPIDVIHEVTQTQVENYLIAELSSEKHEEEFVYGCWALTGPGTDKLQVGPVRIEAREIWLQREEASERVSLVTARRIRRTWTGSKCRNRKPSFDSRKEQAIIDTVGKCQTVCSVATKGISRNTAAIKAPLVARLALTGLALSWQTPSRALYRMGLLIDKPIHHKHSFSFSPKHISGLYSSISHIDGQFVTDEWLTLWPSLSWLIGPIGDALSAYVRPQHPPNRPKVLSALFMSLWWFHEGCREESSLLAIVKFSASLDALAGGGASRGIQELIDARLSISVGSPLMKDGRMTADVVKELYSKARSRAIHGNTEQHGHDWQTARNTAEAISRLCLTASCDWIAENPDSDDLMALRQPDAT